MEKYKISVVVPVYNLQNQLEHCVNSILTQTYGNLEIILVDDFCPQKSWEVIQELCEKDKHVVGIHMSRNFGQIKAITAGLDQSRGDWVVVMDCDLQDRPESIPELFK